VSEWSLSMGQMNRVVDQQKLEESSLDKKMIPLTLYLWFRKVWISQGLDKQQYASHRWLYNL